MPKKLKMLAYCDSPMCHSGFAQVARNILTRIHDTGMFDIDCFAVNHPLQYDEYGAITENPYPFKIMDAKYITPEEQKAGFSFDDVYGRSKLLKLLSAKNYDVIWSVQDPYVVEFIPKALKDFPSKLGKKAPISMLYFPVDAAHTHDEWLETPLEFDFPVAYTHFGKNEVTRLTEETVQQLERVKNDAENTYKDAPSDENKNFWEEMRNNWAESCDYNKKAHDMPVVYHGTNLKDFYYDKDIVKEVPEIKEQVFGDKNAFVVMNLNRNQGRKDMPRTLQMFKELKKEIPNAVLWMFCREMDTGWHLGNVARAVGLKRDKDVFFVPYPEGSRVMQGLPLEAIKEAYIIADVVVSTTLGEGWGLSATEAMACKTPVVMPNNTSMPEILGDGERGWLVECGKTANDWIFPAGTEKEPPRPQTDIFSMIEQIKEVHDNKDLTRDKVEKAYKWAQEHSWDIIFEKQWLPILKQVSDLCQKE